MGKVWVCFSFTVKTFLSFSFCYSSMHKIIIIIISALGLFSRFSGTSACLVSGCIDKDPRLAVVLVSQRVGGEAGGAAPCLAGRKGFTCLLRGDFRKSLLHCPGCFPGRCLRMLPGWLCSNGCCFPSSILSWRPAGLGEASTLGSSPGVARGFPTVGEQWSLLVFWD